MCLVEIPKYKLGRAIGRELCNSEQNGNNQQFGRLPADLAVINREPQVCDGIISYATPT